MDTQEITRIVRKLLAQERALAEFTQDHWAKMFELEALCVDQRGRNDEHRSNASEHLVCALIEQGWVHRTATEAADYFSLTDTGWRVAAALRRCRATAMQAGMSPDYKAAALAALDAR